MQMVHLIWICSNGADGAEDRDDANGADDAHDTDGAFNPKQAVMTLQL